MDFFSLGKFKCRLESGAELNTSAGVECYKLCLFVGDGLRCSLAYTAKQCLSMKKDRYLCSEKAVALNRVL